jgi:hypothetical protein
MSHLRDQLSDIAAIDAAVTDKLANTGVIVSTNAMESSGLAFLGTTKVPPGNISSLSNGIKGRTGIWNPFFLLKDTPFGCNTYILDLSASFLVPPASLM